MFAMAKLKRTYSISFKVLIPEDDSVRLLSYVLEGLNYKKLYLAYSSVYELKEVTKVPHLFVTSVTYNWILNPIYLKYKK